MHTPNPEIPNIPNTTPDVGTRLSFGPARPVVLFPVRLETRFFPHPAGGFELRVRVYPDTVHIDSHEPELTADELTWGQHFWEQTWRAANDEERAKAAWRQLADRFDSPRAAWIAHALKPLNPPDDRPDTPIDPDKPLPRLVRFPSVQTKDESWTRAPQARVLPNRWIVLGYQDGRLVVNVQGALIRDPLAMGPDPSLPDNADAVEIDAGMKWMVDFAEAEAAGMAIRARLSTDQALAGLDFLLVLGIKDAPGGTTDWTPQLAELFDAHHYTGGLSFVAQGTPTNNTQDAPSGFSSQDPGHEESYGAERAAPAPQPGDGSNAGALTAALGLANAGPIFVHLSDAASKELLDARHMNTALWQATWGYFLLQMLGVGGNKESPLTDDDIAWARQHFIDYVRANGPLPALRVGKQPYGVLPVTSLNAWQPQPGQDSQFKREVALRDFLMRLRDLWRRKSSQAPRLGRTEEIDLEKGIDKDLAEVLSMDAVSSSYSIRHLMGRHYLEHLFVFLSADFLADVWEDIPGTSQEAKLLARTRALRLRAITAWRATQEGLAAAVLQTFGVTWRPRLAHAVFSTPVVPLGGPLVQAGPSLSLAPNYIQTMLAGRDLNNIQFETVQQPRQRTLLYLLLRHSFLLEYVAAASRLLINRGLLQPALRREPELVDFPLGQSVLVGIRRMAAKISVQGETEQIQLGKYLLGFTPTGEPDVDREPDLKSLSEFRASLAHLGTLNVPRLEQLLTGALDLCSHRLDAWITSFATKRLDEMRKANPTGVLFGGYGWVMNLRPAPAQTQAGPVPGEDGPIFQSPANPGFVHAPSLTQAATAAVLRSGHLAHLGEQTSNDLLAIDLSSERVRLATWLLDGVRQGQPLGALLGYRFERRLQEAGLAEFISYFRELAPLVARKLGHGDGPGTRPVEAIAANNVVDGLELQRRWLAAMDLLRHSFPAPGSVGALTLLFGPLTDKPAPARLLDAKAKLEAELNSLADAVDAVSDALMAESVHQAVRGNPLRAASTLESIAGGETPPPELEVVQTPRTGIALTHRVVALFGGDPVLPPGWVRPPRPFRADAEPHLNAWAAKLLGNPTKVRCVVERLEPETGQVLESKEIRLSELRLAPLDFIHSVEGGQAGQQAEIEQRILYAITRKPDGFPPGSLLRVNPSRKPGWRADEVSYGEFSELLRSARKLLTGVRGIDADDLNPPERSVEFSADVVELEKRVAAAEQSLRRLRNDFQAQLAQPNTVNLEGLRELILRSAGFGVAGAVPLSAAGDLPADRETLLTQAGSIQREVVQRVTQLAAFAAGFNAGASTAEEKRVGALTRLHIIFGQSFVVLLRFSVANAEELEQALADNEKVQDGDPFASTVWFQRMARVRDGVARLNHVLGYAEALGSGEKLKLTIAQLPYGANDRWVGLPLKAKQNLPGGKLSIAVQSTTPVDVRQPLAGVLADEWVEVVPNAIETTGIAFQYDQPNAAPPQTILIAVPPAVDAPWTVWSLQQVLLETLDLARVRAVDPDALDEIGHYLPALYFAINTANHTVSTDFSAIK